MNMSNFKTRFYICTLCIYILLVHKVSCKIHYFSEIMIKIKMFIMDINLLYLKYSVTIYVIFFISDYV